MCNKQGKGVLMLSSLNEKPLLCIVTFDTSVIYCTAVLPLYLFTNVYFMNVFVDVWPLSAPDTTDIS